MLRFLCSLLLLVPFAAFAGPILNISDTGTLLGAEGVDVNGSLYDVRFEDSLCLVDFSNCLDEEFEFQSREEAEAASFALLDQVLLDSSLGLFDSDPSSVGTCGSRSSTTPACAMFTISSVVPSGGIPGELFYRGFIAGNSDSSGLDVTNFAHGNRGVLEGLGFVRAAWTPSSTDVPEPAMALFLSLSLAGLWLRKQRPLSGSAM